MGQMIKNQRAVNRMAREKKQKKVKEKKAKTGKSKKKLIIILLVLLLAGGGGAYFFLFRNKDSGGGTGKDGKKITAKIPDPVDNYTIGSNSVASVTTAYEDMGTELLISISSNVPIIPAASEGDGSEEENKDASSEAPADTAAPVIAVDDGTQWSYYYYQITEDSQADLERYAGYLEDQGFKKAPVEGENAEEDAAEEEEEKPEWQTEANGIYQKDASTENHVFSIEIEYPLANDPKTGLYSIKAKVEEAEIIEPMTRESAADYFQSLDYISLGLAMPFNQYYITMDMGRTFVDGKDCYGINIYGKGDSSQSYFVKKFYMSLLDKSLYEYENGNVTEIEAVPASSARRSGGSGGSGGSSGSGVHEWNFGPA